MRQHIYFNYEYNTKEIKLYIKKINKKNNISNERIINAIRFFQIRIEERVIKMETVYKYKDLILFIKICPYISMIENIINNFIKEKMNRELNGEEIFCIQEEIDLLIFKNKRILKMYSLL